MNVQCKVCGRITPDLVNPGTARLFMTEGPCGRFDCGATGNSIDHPKHYNFGSIEVINVIDDWGLGFSLGNALKYIARAPHKGNQLEDLKKARWYLDHEISRLEKEQSGGT